MDTMNAEQACPLCTKDQHMGKKAKVLYGHPVCKKCYYAFANRRQLAFVIDIILWNICLGVVFGLSGLPIDAARGLGFLLFPIFCLKEGISGSSPGKAMMGVQTINTLTGRPSGFGSSFKRNLPLMIPFAALFVVSQLSKGNRWGDGWAHTRVVWKKYRNKAPFIVGVAENSGDTIHNSQ